MQQGSAFDRPTMERSLSALGNRVFLMNNVHDDGPTIFQSRWAMSFLRGPLSRDQISKLMSEKKKSVQQNGTEKTVRGRTGGMANNSLSRPIIPSDVTEKFLVPTKVEGDKNKKVYRPAILCQSSIHFVKSTAGVDYWEDVQYMVDIQDEVPDPIWDHANKIEPDGLQLSNQPEDGYTYSELPAEMSSSKNYSLWEKAIKDYYFRHLQCTVYTCKAIKKTTSPGMSETDARIELSHAAKEARDEIVEKL